MKNILIILFLSVFMLAGCSTSVNNMIPVLNNKIFNHYNKTITIGPVISNTPHSFSDVNLDNKKFKEAVYFTLKKAHIFSKVIKKTKADYQLNIKIKAQGLRRESCLTFSFALVVSYVLIDNKTGHEIWHDTIVSCCKKTVSDSLIGGTRMNMAIECAVKENLRKLVKELSKLSVLSVRRCLPYDGIEVALRGRE